MGFIGLTPINVAHLKKLELSDVQFFWLLVLWVIKKEKENATSRNWFGIWFGHSWFFRQVRVDHFGPQKDNMCLRLQLWGSVCNPVPWKFCILYSGDFCCLGLSSHVSFGFLCYFDIRSHKRENNKYSSVHLACSRVSTPRSIFPPRSPSGARSAISSPFAASSTIPSVGGARGDFKSYTLVV